MSAVQHVLPFPAHLARAPHHSGGLLDKATWDRCWVQAHVADWWREVEPEAAEAAAREMMEVLGIDALAKVLEQNADAIGVLRAMLASLIEADRRLAAAADRVLQSRGM